MAAKNDNVFARLLFKVGYLLVSVGTLDDARVVPGGYLVCGQAVGDDDFVDGIIVP